MDDTLIRGPLERPDPQRSGHWFKDDGYIYEVAAYPALMPIFMTQGGFSLLLAVFYLAFWSLIGPINPDPRWKVVVATKPIKRATMFHAVHVEFFESSEAADARQDEIVRQWRRGQFTGTTPMTSLELRRARRETRSGRPVPAARTLAGYSLTRLRARAASVLGTMTLAIGLGAIGLGAIGLDLSARALVGGYMAIVAGLVAIALGIVLWIVDRVTSSRLVRDSETSPTA